MPNRQRLHHRPHRHELLVAVRARVTGGVYRMRRNTRGLMRG